MRVIRILIYVKNCLSFRNIVSSFKIFFYNLLKQNTRYPNYLLNFEKEISNYFGSKYALSFSNGTTACTALLYSLGVKKNSKIILSKLTFPSVVSSILRVGATPIYLDFDKNFQIEENSNREQIISADFFLITHAYGLPQDIEKVKSILSLNKKLILIEDISHAQGATTNNVMVGTLGAGSFMSMQGDKAINAGEGGIVLTNNENVYNRLIYLSHLNRKNSKNENLNLLSKIGFIGKGRMNPLGAITALGDIKNLNKRNKSIREKVKIIYEDLGNLKNFEVPKVKNYENLGGFHYGIPFFCNVDSSLDKLKKNFKIVKYNWPILDADENFHNPDNFLKLMYSNDPKIEKVFRNSDDHRDELYFFDLNEIMNLNKTKIKKKIEVIKKYEN